MLNNSSDQIVIENEKNGISLPELGATDAKRNEMLVKVPSIAINISTMLTRRR